MAMSMRIIHHYARRTQVTSYNYDRIQINILEDKYIVPMNLQYNYMRMIKLDIQWRAYLKRLSNHRWIFL